MASPYRSRFRLLATSINTKLLTLKRNFKGRSRSKRLLKAQQQTAVTQPDPENSQCAFPRFNELPTEIRLAIWEMVLPGPRLVLLELERSEDPPSGPSSPSGPSIPQGWIRSKCPIKPKQARENTNPSVSALSGSSFRKCKEVDPSTLPAFHSNATPLVLLYVCQESNEVASKLYTKFFGPASGTRSIPIIWFDFKNDTLLLEAPSGTPYHLDGDRKNWIRQVLPRLFKRESLLVQNVAVRFNGASDPVPRLLTWLAWIILIFKNARKFVYELPTTEQSPGPWLTAHGEVVYFQKQQFDVCFQNLKRDSWKTPDRCEAWLGKNWVMPEIVERQIS